MRRTGSFRLGVLLAFCLFSLFSFNGYTQVGIGTTNPNTDALLDVDASTTLGGLLLPRVTLSATNNFAPLTAHVAGMTVYNTATAGTAPDNVTPGYYYNDGAKWVRIAADLPSDDWYRTGNAGTVAGTNFLGTTDDVSVRFRTFNGDRFEISSGDVANRGRLRAFENGSAAQPTYSWTGNVGTGIYQQAANVLGFSTNGAERFRIPNANQVYAVVNGTSALPFYSWASDTDIGMYRIGTNTLGFSALQASVNGNPIYVGDRFTVNGAANEYVINGYASGTSGIGIYGESSAFDAIVGNAARFGVVGFGVYGTFGSGVTYGSYGIVANATGMGIRAVNQNVSGTGLLASGNNIAGNYLVSGSGVAGTGDTGVYGRSSSVTGTGVIASGNNNASITISSKGSGLAGSGSSIGVFGYAGLGGIANGNRGNHGGEFILDSDNNPTTNSAANGTRATAILAGFNEIAASGTGGIPNLPTADSYFGGYFSGGNEDTPATPSSYAYVGLRYITGSNGTTGTDYKIIGPGTVSTLINDENDMPRIMFAPESPEIVFQDYGVGKLVNGEARIKIDPILKKSLYIDEQHPLKVYVTLEGDCNGIYVTNKSVDGFTVKELQGGASNVSFSWQIVANRADTKNASGNIVSKHVGLRLPMGPGSLKVEAIQLEAKEVKAELKSKGGKTNSIAYSVNVSDENSNKNSNTVSSESLEMGN